VKPVKVVDPFYTSIDWLKLRSNFFKMVGRVCQQCGSTDRVSAHHKIPRKQNGPDEISNLQALCHGCHNRAHR
jgi:5-methylcytosine-specific restriction protein A